MLSRCLPCVMMMMIVTQSFVLCVLCCVSDVSKLSVLVPGAGLGRLAWEIARLGYMCQGNEWSFFMLFSSNFVLNRYEFTLKLYYAILYIFYNYSAIN